LFSDEVVVSAKEIRMGLDVQSLRLLLLARSWGVKFERTITIGRQDLLLTPHQVVHVCSQFGLQITDSEAKHIAFGKDRFSELMFEKLGAIQVDSLDASSFEGATIIHDLNQPLPLALAGNFSLVFDGGTLEHIFDFPKAIQSCMELLEIGGHFLMTSPANNLMGHGFYQFSPDLFYRIFSQSNGFQLKGLFLVPTFGAGHWFKVRDPAIVAARVGHNAALEAQSLFVIAERTSLSSLFTQIPQQSDYAAEWSNLPNKGLDRDRLSFFDRAIAEAEKSDSFLQAGKRVLKGLVPQSILRWRRAVRAARHIARPPDSACFEPFSMPPNL
jgi:hypothetical protein